MSHTKEPWIPLDCRTESVERITISSNERRAIARIENTRSGKPISLEDEANARRIVACVNACAGIPTDMLETAPNGFFMGGKITQELTEQRDELLVAIEELMYALHGNLASPCATARHPRVKGQP